MTPIDVHTAAGNLMLAHYTLTQLPESQARIRATERYAWMLVEGAAAGLAESPAELELMVADVVELLPLPGETDRGGLWIWLMQTRYLLARRLGDRLFPEPVAA